MNVNTTVLQNLHEAILNWERNQVRSREEDWSYNKFEKSMNEYENAINYAKSEYGMKPIGEGRDRITFTSGNVVSSDSNVVIKMSKSDGTQQNEEEVRIYEKLKEDVGKDIDKYVALIPKYDKNYRWIIQKRASQGSPPGASKELREKFKKIGWSCSDIRPDNVGIINDEIVLIDLGIGLRK